MSVLIVADIKEGEIQQSTYAAIAAGLVLKGLTGSFLDVLVSGKGANRAVTGNIGRGARFVFCSEIDLECSEVVSEPAMDIARFIYENGYRHVVIASTGNGRGLLAQLSAQLKCEVDANVVRFEKAGGSVACLTGEPEARVVAGSPVQVCTVAEGAFDPGCARGGGGILLEFNVPWAWRVSTESSFSGRLDWEDSEQSSKDLRRARR